MSINTSHSGLTACSTVSCSSAIAEWRLTPLFYVTSSLRLFMPYRLATYIIYQLLSISIGGLYIKKWEPNGASVPSLDSLPLVLVQPIAEWRLTPFFYKTSNWRPYPYQLATYIISNYWYVCLMKETGVPS